ncbi:16872_t:CDS:1, partial [Racocetra fulgida]
MRNEQFANKTFISEEHLEQVWNTLLSTRYEELEFSFKNIAFFLKNPFYPAFFYPNYCEFKESFAMQRNLPENHNGTLSDLLDKHYSDFLKEPL